MSAASARTSDNPASGAGKSCDVPAPDGSPQTCTDPSSIKANDEKLVGLAAARIVELDPFDAGTHTVLGRAALRAKDPAVSVREFKVALSIGPADRASAHCDLAESYLLANRPADAKREALAALEIAPSFERAQDILLKAIDGAK